MPDFASLPVKSLRGAKRRGNRIHREIASLSLAMTRNGYVFQNILTKSGFNHSFNNLLDFQDV